MDIAAQLGWIDGESEAMTDLVARWAEIGSGSGNLDGLQRMAGEVGRALGALGARVEAEAAALPGAEAAALPGADAAAGPTVVALKRPELPFRVFLGCHMDTVFGPDHPFRRTSRPEPAILQGPGVADAKGGLVVLLKALEAFERTSLAGRVGWEVVVNPDEETGSLGSRGPLARAARRCRLGLVFEPSFADGSLVSARKGSGTFDVVVHGRAAHAGRDPERGRNAIVALASFVLRLRDLRGAGIVVNPGQIEGGTAPNVVPDRALCRINARVETAEEQRRVESFLAAAAAEVSREDGIRVEIGGGFGRPPKPLDPPTEALLRDISGCGRELGLDLGWRPSGGASDGNLLAAEGLPTVDSLGPQGGDLHSDREFIFVESLAQRAKLTALFLLRLAAGELEASAGLEGRS